MSKKEKSKWNIEINIGGISNTDLLLFTKHLSVALKSGLTLYEGIDMLFDQAAGRMKRVLKDVLEIIKSGKPFYEALAKYPKYFSPIYINLVRTGEIAGTLEENLNHLATELKKSYELRQKVKSAMMYPILIFVAVIGLGMAIALFVLPKIVPLFKTLNVQLPASTRALIYFAEISSKHGLALALWTIGGVIFLNWFFKRKMIKPILHKFFLKIPVVKTIIININLERFMRTLATLLQSSIPVDKCLQITADATVNEIYKRAIISFIPEVQKGNTLSASIAHYPDIFPKITSRMIGMGERTGSLDRTLKYLSEFYGGEVDSIMKNLSTILEPVLLIFIGVIVGTVAISILGPIYKITGNLKQ